MSYQLPQSPLETASVFPRHVRRNSQLELDASENSAKLRFCQHCHAWSANQQFGRIESDSSVCAVCGSDFDKRKLLQWSRLPFSSVWLIGVVIVVGTFVSVTVMRNGM
ncbi:hypothetical protein AAFX33_22345 [Vibrio chagasii]|uniref:hypothetical protein n=1 Tax=Vibrio chagasii TaxID=170679 RepID=UPI0038CD8767